MWVCAGGAFGSGARYLVSLASARLWGTALWGTLAVNVTGSFLLALLISRGAAGHVSESMRLLLGVGVLGGFTTFSTFNGELLLLAEQGAVGRAVLYAGGTLAASLVAGTLGLLLAR